MVQEDTPPTEQVRALEARIRDLEEELRIRDAFIVAAAHELRNPVSPLALQVQRLQNAARTAVDGSVSAGWLSAQLDTFARRLGRFISALNRILDVSKMRSGAIDLVPEQVDLSELTREVTAGFERELAASRSVLTLLASEAVTGHWDRLRLEQIVSNLVSNAIRYGKSGPITVRVEADEGRAVLVVEDRGIGVSPEDRVRIFERFERGEAGDRSGFGIGLWVVRKLCLAMRGDVQVESRTGGGSTFTVTLPRRLDPE